MKLRAIREMGEEGVTRIDSHNRWVNTRTSLQRADHFTAGTAWIIPIHMLAATEKPSYSSN